VPLQHVLAQRALAQQALQASDERLAAIMSKHERLEADMVSRAGGRRGASVGPVRARPEGASDAGTTYVEECSVEECSDVHLAMELAEAAAEAETALRVVENSRLQEALAAAEDARAAAEAFCETLAKDMGAAVAQAAMFKREASEAKARLAAEVDARTEKVGELLEEIDHWHEVAVRAQEGERQAREDKVRAELQVAAIKMGEGKGKTAGDETQEEEDDSLPPSMRGKKELTVAATEAEAEEELEGLKKELEQAKKAAATADGEMATLRREAEEEAAAARAAAMAAMAAAAKEDGAAKGEMERAHAAAAAAAQDAVDEAAEKLRWAEEVAAELKASVEDKDDELSAVRKQLQEAKVGGCCVQVELS
jgi:chromosome segregation ATPase